MQSAWSVLVLVVVSLSLHLHANEKCEKYVKHVVEGDFGKNPRRLVRPPVQVQTIVPGDFIMSQPQQEPWANPVVIKGGLHTFQGLRKFLAQRPDLIPLGNQILLIED